MTALRFSFPIEPPINAQGHSLVAPGLGWAERHAVLAIELHGNGCGPWGGWLGIGLISPLLGVGGFAPVVLSATLKSERLAVCVPAQTKSIGVVGASGVFVVQGAMK